MQHLRLWRILLGVVSGVTFVALSLGLLAAAPVQAESRPSPPLAEPGVADSTILPELDRSLLIRATPIDTEPTILSLPSQQVDTNIGLMRVWGGGNNAQVWIHMQLVESNVQYQFNFNELSIVRDENNTPIGVDLTGWREKSSEERAEATATVSDDHQGWIDVDIFTFGPDTSERISFRTEGSIVFEEPDPRQ